MTRGTLHLVVGPSGAGKDTLIDAARLARPDLLIPRRAVTRAADAGGEAIEALSPAEFAARAAAGGFALHWQAHGLGYGIPADIETALARGRCVLANVSRAVIPVARARFQPLRILVVMAALDVLAARLAARGREDAADIAARLARAGQDTPQGADVTVIDNGGDLAAGIAAFLAAIQPVRA